MASSSSAAPLWPWVEANQGLLSLAAIALALAIALVEFFRAERASLRLRAGFISSISALLQMAEQSTSDLIEELQAPRMTWLSVEHWRGELGSTKQTLDLLRASAPADAALILLLQHVSDVLGLNVEGAMELSGADVEALDDWLGRLQQVRKTIEDVGRRRRR